MTGLHVPPLIQKVLRLLANKDLYRALYGNVSGANRKNTFAVLGNVCLLLSAVLKTFGCLIESNKFVRLQKLARSLRYSVYILARHPFARPSQHSTSGRDFSKTLSANYSSKYIVNSPADVKLNKAYKDNEKIAEDVYAYARVLRSQYSFVTNVQIFESLFSTFSYFPDLISMGQTLPSAISSYKKKYQDSVSSSPPASRHKRLVNLIRSTSLQLIDKVQIVNCFLLQMFQDAAFLGDQGLSQYLTKHSLSNWYISSKFWFLYVAFNMLKYTVEASTSVSLSSNQDRFLFQKIIQFFKDNKGNFVNLVLAYHWGFNWGFLNDYQLSSLNLYNHLPTFISNWSGFYQIIQNELAK